MNSRLAEKTYHASHPPPLLPLPPDVFVSAGAVSVSAEDEAARVIPVIIAVRAAVGPKVAISIDTFFAAVARAAVQSGANMVNDISAGTMDGAMLATVAELGVPLILMHTRGTPSTMSSLAVYAPTADGSRGTDAAESAAVVREVSCALEAAAEAAIATGIPRWDIVLDPGLGFAKLPVHSFALLRPNEALTSMGFPLLFGPSRKGFLGVATGKEDPRARGHATAAAVTAAVAAGAAFVRVHDVAEMVDVVRVADAVTRARV